VRLVRVPRRLDEQGQCPLVHVSRDAQLDGEPCLLDQLVDQLPATQATALRLTVLEGLSLRAAAEQLKISPFAQACWMPRVKSGHPWPRLMASSS
jgi:DNA-directed RNA polymerase specialized sigma24 family protein